MRASTTLAQAGTDTVLDRLIEHIRAKDISLDGQLRPVAILWTDPTAEWQPIIPTMRTQVPELLVLGDYQPNELTGPAIWLRCMVDRTLDEPKLPDDVTPIIYLPGVARQDLRAGDQCREELKPLVELMFRGTMWLQHNGSDWAVSTFLTSTKALGLKVARDQKTAEAMLRALPEIVLTPVAQLSGRQLEADDFDRMLNDDVIRDVLRWMGDPEGIKALMGVNGWGAFCSRCRDELIFDPSTEADVTAGERLGMRVEPWAKVWARFAEAPSGFPGVVELLRRSRPTGSLLFDREPWPDFNDEDEAAARAALAESSELAQNRACDRVAELEKQHGPRREWAWARLGLSPMAVLLKPLSRLAQAVRSPIGGNSPDAIADTYRERGWQADAAAWEAIAVSPASDEALVCRVVSQLMGPWLDDSARAFQKAVVQNPLPAHGAQTLVEATDNGCVFFCDGLRYDLGVRLADRLEGRGYRVTMGDRWAATPTVTATAKPAVSPVAGGIVGDALGKDFVPRIERGNKPAIVANLRKTLEEEGYQLLGTELDLPLDQPARGWLEWGEIDSLGHKLKGQLARQIDDQLDRLADRIGTLLEAGWDNVRLVTDHGWLLLPGGLPRVDLPKHLTESRWARCAVVAGDSTPDVPRFPWFWNAGQYFATAPGAACFNTTEEYAHGGLSIQECLVPDILVEKSGESEVKAAVVSVTWRGLRCFVEVSYSGAGVSADLRLAKPAGESVAAAPKLVEDDAVSLVLASDEHEGDQLVLVLLSDAGAILAHRPTRVGEDT